MQRIAMGQSVLCDETVLVICDETLSIKLCNFMGSSCSVAHVYATKMLWVKVFYVMKH